MESLRDAPWLNRERIRAYPKLLLAVYILAYAVWLVANVSTAGPRKPIGADFASFYAASVATLRGHPADVYDLAKHHALEQEVAGKDTFINPWYYPPMFLVIVLPMAVAPYLVSLAIWLGLTLAGYLYVIWRIAPRKEALWLALAFPGAAANIANAQNGFLTFGLLGGGLLLLERTPIAAGFLFGLLAYKPQMAILIPFVLITSGRRRALFAAAATAIIFAMLSLILFGADTWRAFFHSAEFVRHTVVEGGGVKFFTMQSTFAAARLLGGAIATAYVAHALVFLIAAVAVIAIWRSQASYNLKASVLVIGAVLSSIHIIYYDLVLLGLPIAWLAVEGERTDFLPYEKTLLLVAWMLPMLCEFVAQHLSIPLTPLVCLLLMTAVISRARRSW